MVPVARLQTLVDVYRVLAKEEIAGVIECERMKVKGKTVPLDRKARLRGQFADLVLVELRLKPVGAQLEVRSTAELRSLLRSLLTTLKGLQVARLVHRDIRNANVGRLAQSCSSPASATLHAFANQLCSGSHSTAADALRALEQVLD
ncbi:g7129 [Coccomyxa elongata]